MGVSPVHVVFHVYQIVTEVVNHHNVRIRGYTCIVARNWDQKAVYINLSLRISESW